MQTFATIPLHPGAGTGTFHSLARQTVSGHKPRTIAEIQSAVQIKDHVLTVRGYIKRHVRHTLYEFSDGTGSVYLDLSTDMLRWLSEQKFDQTMRLEVWGSYIDEALSYDRIKVIGLELAQ